jgi:hypothetical protein
MAGGVGGGAGGGGGGAAGGAELSTDLSSGVRSCGLQSCGHPRPPGSKGGRTQKCKAAPLP